MHHVIEQAFEAQSPLIIDGAMATELEKRGVDTANELWSAMALIRDPEAVRNVHESYFEAGANIAITNTYQANIPAFERLGFTHAEAKRLIATAVNLALEARKRYQQQYRSIDGAVTTENSTTSDRPLLVAGSVGPYGAFLADGSEYTGAYHLSDADYRDFHRERMRILADSGVDVFACETMPNIGEAQALFGLLAEEFADTEAWVSFSLKDSHHLCDGTPLEEAVAAADACSQIGAVGINCVPIHIVAEAISVVRSATDKPIIVYPNNGDIYHPETKTWTPNPNGLTLAGLASQWVAAGAALIGGCCRTSPADIRDLARTIGSR